MSACALYRVVVRMLYDGGFAERVYDDTDSALADLELTAAERGYLVVPDPRAYRTDGGRRARSLTGLIEEYPATCALVVRQAGDDDAGVRQLDAFFESKTFHAAVQGGSSMALAFGAHLEVVSGALPSRAWVRSTARLEAVIASVRRVAPVRPQSLSTGSGAGLMLAPWCAIDTWPTGTSQLHEQFVRVFAQDRRHVLESILDGGTELPEPGGVHEGEEWLLVEQVAGSDVHRQPAVRYAAVTDELGELLSSAVFNGTRERLERRAVDLGADPDDAPIVIGELVDEGLLIPAS